MNNFKIKKIASRIESGSIAGSLFLHLLVIVVIFLIVRSYESNFEQPGYSVFTSLDRIGIASTERNEITSSKDNLISKNFSPQGIFNEGQTSGSSYSKIEKTGFDSTNLTQIYREPSLMVQLKYPLGWIYVDQQIKNKLDGITFWPNDNSINPPPYIHVEVVEKYYFNSAKYKYNYKFKNFEGFYNGPDEMEEQVSQEIYLRTDEEEDFIIKLIINGRDNFNKFQPVFFAMINSFQFGNSSFF